MANNTVSTIVFVDSNVADRQSLANSVEPETKVVVLDANRNGVEQIAEELTNYNSLDSIQILAHGDSASLQLGNGSLNEGNIESYENQLQQWGESLGENGDILLYGCNVAQGEQGQAFISRLSEIAKADVAASEDLTGNSDLGGDWVLEATTGFIDAPLAFQVEAMSAFNSVLEVFEVINTNDSGAGSLREAIGLANINNNAGDNDTIIINLPGDVDGTISLNSSLPTITEDVEIQGNNVTINGSPQSQILAIDNSNTGNDQVILSDLTLQNGRARGGSDGAGAGGGLGAGGALFINDGTVVTNQVTFTNNSAVGGSAPVGTGRGGDTGKTGSGGSLGGGFNITGGAFFTDQNGKGVGGSGGSGGSTGFFSADPGDNGDSGGGGAFGFGGGSGGGGGGGGGGSNPQDTGSGRKTALGGAGGASRAFGGTGGNGGNVDINSETPGNGGAGGGGAGLGGAIFVNEGARLILLNSIFSGNTTTGGLGANNGQARGNDIFIKRNFLSNLRNVSQVGTTINDVDGYVSDFILPTINIAPGNNLSESQSDEIGSKSAPDVDSSFQLSLDRALPIDLVVNYTITGTAINDPDLFDNEEIDRFDLSIPVSVTIPAGETTGSIDLDLIDDRIFDIMQRAQMLLIKALPLMT